MINLSDILMKWVEPKHPLANGMDLKLIDHCMLLAKDVKGTITGLTCFAPRDLNEGFFDKLVKRQTAETNSSFEIYLTPYLQHRFEKLNKEKGIRFARTSFTRFFHIRCEGRIFSVRDQLHVVNVDDSPVLLKFLKHTLSDCPYVKIVSQISNSQEAVAGIIRHKPDVVTLDIQMPNKNGVEVLQELLEQKYFPVIMVSAVGLEEGSQVFEALNAGAFDYVQKPKLDEKEAFQEQLLDRVMAAAANKVSSRITRTPTASKKVLPAIKNLNLNQPKLLWCLGASTGGTQALTKVFTSLPDQIPPTLIVQHIPPVFSKSFADSLNQLCPFKVTEAVDGEVIENNHVYIAPGGMQMGIREINGQLRIAIRDDEPVNRFKPSVDYMFKEVAQLKNYQIVAGILTGMGRDGAEGLLTLKNIGARTIGQDEETSAVYGMPRAAFEIGAVDKVVPVDQFAQVLMTFSQKEQRAA